MKRRNLLKLFGVAPAIILTPKLLMPVHSIQHHNDYYRFLSHPNGDRIRKDYLPDGNKFIGLNPGDVISARSYQARDAGEFYIVSRDD